MIENGKPLFLLMLLANATIPTVAVCLVLLSRGFDTRNRPPDDFYEPRCYVLSFPTCLDLHN